MSQGPEFYVAENARNYVRDAFFDSERFIQYLLQRRVPEEEFANLRIGIDSQGMSRTAYGIYNARDPKDPASRHSIKLSPRRIPRDTVKQGRNLRHETEHFIYQTRHPNHIRNRIILVSGATAVGGVFGGLLGVETGMHISQDLPLIAEVPIVGATGITGTAVGSISALMPASMAHIACGPSEIQAMWAERRQSLALPDDVIQIELT